MIGEILVGIALGPSLLGQISPRLQSYLFSASDVPIFKIVAELGLVLFMFVVGMEVVDETALSISACSRNVLSRCGDCWV